MDNVEQPVVNVTENAKLKRDAKLTQLGNARETANAKKRQRDSDLAYIKVKVAALDEKLNPVAESVAPVMPENETPTVKRQKIVTKENTSESATESWATSLIRTTAVLGLGAASYWFQHRYGKTPTNLIVQKKPEIEAPAQKVLCVPDRATPMLKVGGSGFTH